MNAGGKPKLSDALKELLPLAAHWKTIGVLLGLSDEYPGKIELIESNEKSVENKLQAMLSEWLKTPMPQPTWNSLADAVEHVDHIKAELIRNSSVNDFS